MSKPLCELSYIEALATLVAAEAEITRLRIGLENFARVAQFQIDLQGGEIDRLRAKLLRLAPS